MIIIRPETPDDYTAIYEVNQLAFDGSDAEPQLVEAIRQSAEFIPELSLVAEENGRVVGHILFSPITIEAEAGSIPALALAPMAVLPECRSHGIGTTLVRYGLEKCKRLSHRIIVVLGHPSFYPRFGFSADLAKPLDCPFGDCKDAWMALELMPGALDGVIGTAVFPKAFENI
jgi:putative acetyltransferase